MCSLINPYKWCLLVLLVPLFANAQKAKFQFYTTADGLAANQTSLPAQDDQGMIWLTSNGQLQKFDGYRFITYPPRPADLPGANEPLMAETVAFQDSLLFLASAHYVFLLNPKINEWKSFKIGNNEQHEYDFQLVLNEGKIYFKTLNFNQQSRFSPWVFDGQTVKENHKQGIDFISTNFIPIFDQSQNSYFIYYDTLYKFNVLEEELRKKVILPEYNGTSFLSFDPNDQLVFNRSFLFYIIDKEFNRILPHPINRHLKYLYHYPVRFIIEPSGNIWAIGGEQTLVYYDATKDTLYDFKKEIIDQYPDRNDFIRLTPDRNGTVWVKSQLGLLKISPQTYPFDTYFTGTSRLNLSYSFRGFGEDDQGNIYGSCYGFTCLIKIDPYQKKEYIYDIKETYSLPFGLFAEGSDIWLADGSLFHTKTQVKEKIIGSSPIDSQDDGLFLYDKNKSLWKAGNGHLFQLNKSSNPWEWHKIIRLPIIQTQIVDAFHYGKQSGHFLMGSMNQLFAYHPQSNTLKTYDKEDWDLDISRIMAIEETATGQLWLATDIGLVHFDPVSGQTQLYAIKEGLPNEFVCGLLTEGDSCLWLSTNFGLSRFHIPTTSFTNFFEEDGLTHNEFNRASYFKARDGRMFFGGLRGFNAFYPKEVMAVFRQKSKAAHVVLSSFEYLNGQKDTFIQDLFFRTQPTIHLYHGDRSFKFEYAFTDYDNPSAIFYSYKMDGYDEHWSSPSKFNFTRFSSLPSGNYTFRVKARDSKGAWHLNQLAVKVVVHPPWWQTWWAYLLYFFTAAVLIYIIYNSLKKRLLLQNELKREQEESVRLKELDGFKSKLYTNLTHEFRTPLTVILGMTQQIKKEPQKYLEEGTRLIETNGKNLLRLINQLLDLSKLENQSFQLKLRQADIIPYLNYVCSSFHSYANSNNISLSFFSPIESLIMDHDQEQIKQVLTNLISNAVKFTPSGGSINIRLGLEKDNLTIEVTDTGIGISPKDLPHIFDRFYQVDDSTTREGEGTGIGLAHTQELVKLMSGSITVKSELKKGSSFIVRLPIRKVAMPMEIHFDKNKTKDHLPVSRTTTEATSIVPSVDSTEKPQLLIVEDNPDVVIYLKSCLDDAYQIDVAYNGKVGIEKALENIPDLIISDVMMPEKDGYEVCDTLKTAERTSHIPIILLTAKADTESKITGLKKGADAYLSKPFDKEELLIRLEKMVEKQKRMLAYFSTKPKYRNNTEEPDVKIEAAIQAEDIFVQKINAILEANIGDEDFGLPNLCQKVRMSRSQLFRKLKALTDTAPSDYIRNYRLQKAKHLLENGDFNVAEAAYEVGFKDPSYFSKIFKEAFGKLPSATNN